MSTNLDERGVHFIIYSPKRNCIFERSFTTREDAEKTMEFEMSSIPVAGRARLDWRIEQRTNAY